jgi:hypothetical protein
VQFESDCMSLIKALRSQCPDMTSWQGVITEIKELSRLLPDCKFNHMKRECNQAAHALGQLAMRWKQWKVVRFRFPPEIAS